MCELLRAFIGISGHLRASQSLRVLFIELLYYVWCVQKVGCWLPRCVVKACLFDQELKQPFFIGFPGVQNVFYFPFSVVVDVITYYRC
jgi:hypothetical protein